MIGRDPSLLCCLNDTQVSRQHAVLVVGQGSARIRDLGSRNGVLVNGARLPDRLAQRLSHGDTIQIGRSELRYEDPAEVRRRRVHGYATTRRHAAPRKVYARTQNLVPVFAVAASAALGVLLSFLG